MDVDPRTVTMSSLLVRKFVVLVCLVYSLGMENGRMDIFFDVVFVVSGRGW